ncbi:MAG: hypothetical protein KDC18_05640 [Alphaproteobacteria bacterium]|nr:hypothetical protein [Alphaproteobacteria bacterium]MCB9931032.1 hypothetical protein [Alphaproteobacteria bacterium]
MVSVERVARFLGAARVNTAAMGASVLAIAATLGLWGGGEALAASALSDKPQPLMKEEDLPKRSSPLIEIGPHFLGRGNLPKGWVLPTGAVWQPAFWVFGSSRTAYDFVESRNGGEDLSEVTSRLDLFGNLQLSGTERVLVGISPLRTGGDFTNYQIEPGDGDGFNRHFNLELTTAFFEGELGEIFPGLDPEDKGAYDISFAIGRQPIFFQEGALVNDTIDALAVNRDTIVIPNLVVDWRMTGLVGVNDIHRADRRRHSGDIMLGWFNELNFRERTVNFDTIVIATQDSPGAYLGVSTVESLGVWNLALRLNGSLALKDETPAVRDGVLGLVEISRTLPHSDHIVYLNGFAVGGNFSPAALDPSAGSALGRAGILFASAELGRYGAALSGETSDTLGGSLGIQMFFNNGRTQLIFEGGGRYEANEDVGSAVAVGAQLRQAFGRRVEFRSDAFYTVQEGRGGDGVGVRAEIAVNF